MAMPFSKLYNKAALEGWWDTIDFAADFSIDDDSDDDDTDNDTNDEL